MHWNDLGNFIGRTARSLNFKYGNDGLSYDYHIDDHYKISVNVTTDTAKALEFLGYDHKMWEEGFDTKEDIFKYAVSSPYFNATYFALDEQAHTDRIRNRKRKMYQAMLEYIQEQGIEQKPKLTPEERLTHYNRARKTFGDDFHHTVEQKKAEYDRHKQFKELFNGDVVSALTGLTGKDLGKFINFVKQRHSDRFESTVIEEGKDYVTSIVLYDFLHYHEGYFVASDDEEEVNAILDELDKIAPLVSDVSQSAGIANDMYKTDKGVYNVLTDIYKHRVIEIEYVLFDELSIKS